MQKTERFSWAPIFLVCVLAGLFSGCATREHPGEIPMGKAPVADVQEPPVAPTPPARFVPRKTTRPTTAPVTEVLSSSRRPIPTSTSRDWASRVREGRVTERTETEIAFQKHGAAPRTTSLFEDSILLSKVRGELQSTPEIWRKLETVRVNRATAYLAFPSDTPSQILTQAVNSALSVEGITNTRLQRK